MPLPVTTQSLAQKVCWIVFLLASFSGRAAAQSTDIAWPSPVRTSEVAGKIVARDLGDPRLTDHFYAFTGTPGDLLITVDSRNLNGDIDVFTFSGLRPLLKFTIYAGNTSPTTKSIYFRKQEDLILRVEGRTPNDEEAIYRVRFGGSFAPITSGPLAEREDALHSAIAVQEPGTGGRRVSSVGARIEEPRTEEARTEVAETPTPEPTPVETPEPANTPARPAARNTRTRRPPPRRTRPTAPTRREETVARTETEEKPPEVVEPETTAPVPARRRGTRRGAAARAAAPPVTPEPEATGPRLLIETSDGTFVDRYMNTVRRVTVENNQVVVVGKDGRVQRIPLGSVVRMTIAP